MRFEIGDVVRVRDEQTIEDTWPYTEEDQHEFGFTCAYEEFYQGTESIDWDFEWDSGDGNSYFCGHLGTITAIGQLSHKIPSDKRGPLTLYEVKFDDYEMKFKMGDHTIAYFPSELELVHSHRVEMPFQFDEDLI